MHASLYARAFVLSKRWVITVRPNPQIREAKTLATRTVLLLCSEVFPTEASKGKHVVWGWLHTCWSRIGQTVEIFGLAVLVSPC